MKNEGQLLKEARELDEKALITIYDHYAPKVYLHALRRCQDPVLADEIVGRVFEQFLDDVATGNEPRKGLQSYFYRSASQFESGRTKGTILPLLERILDQIFRKPTDRQQ